MVLESRSSWGYLEKNKSSFRHGPGESESLGVLEGNKSVSLMQSIKAMPSRLSNFESVYLDSIIIVIT
jgi:hypothetical protein